MRSGQLHPLRTCVFGAGSRCWIRFFPTKHSLQELGHALKMRPEIMRHLFTVVKDAVVGLLQLVQLCFCEICAWKVTTIFGVV